MKNRRGFSLVEAIITLTVIAIVLYNAIAVFLTSNTKGLNVDVFTIAQSLGEGKLEEVMARPFGLLTGEAIENVGGGLAAFSREVTVDYVAGDNLDSHSETATAYKRVIVNVFHPHLSRPLTLESLRANF